MSKVMTGGLRVTWVYESKPPRAYRIRMITKDDLFLSRAMIERVIRPKIKNCVFQVTRHA